MPEPVEDVALAPTLIAEPDPVPEPETLSVTNLTEEQEMPQIPEPVAVKPAADIPKAAMHHGIGEGGIHVHRGSPLIGPSSPHRQPGTAPQHHAHKHSPNHQQHHRDPSQVQHHQNPHQP